MNKLDPAPFTGESVKVNERLKTLSAEEWLKEMEINLSPQISEGGRIRMKYKTEQDWSRSYTKADFSSIKGKHSNY